MASVIKRSKTILFPLLAAIIWGTAFVAQKDGAGLVEPFTFNTARSVVAVATLTVIYFAFRAIKKKNGEDTSVAVGGIKTLLLGGLCCGTALCVATTFQQIGLETTDAGKGGFITALYIVIVPLLGIFFKKRTSVITAISVIVAVVGLYLLCIGDSFSVEVGDILIIICALCFSCHILIIDYFAQRTDGVALSLTQFAVMAIESAILMFIFEKPDMSAVLGATTQILYLGIASSGVAYTFQILAQKGSDPTLVSLLLSLESVFSVISSAIILGERMKPREYIGCAVMLAAVVLAQLSDTVFKKKKKSE